MHTLTMSLAGFDASKPLPDIVPVLGGLASECHNLQLCGTVLRDCTTDVKDKVMYAFTLYTTYSGDDKDVYLEVAWVCSRGQNYPWLRIQEGMYGHTRRGFETVRA